jgi:hypothetical protein
MSLDKFLELSKNLQYFAQINYNYGTDVTKKIGFSPLEYSGNFVKIVRVLSRL